MVRRGFVLEGITLAWNVVGVVVLAVSALASRSVALAGFALDSFVEIAASTVVIWELSGGGDERRRAALRLIGTAFVLLAVYLAAQSSFALIAGHRPHQGWPGIVWTAMTAVVMFALAAGKVRTGRGLGDPVLISEGRVTFVDGLLALAVLIGVTLDAVAGWWWADPLAGYVIAVYGAREAREALSQPGARDP
jgi:Cation efflux family